MGGMPLAAIITIAIIAGVIVLIVAVTFALRARRHKRLSQQLVKRNDDQVHYVFVVNPSKPQAAQRRAHIEQFCRDKGLTDVEFIDTQLDKDGRACAKEALANGADVVVAVGGDGTVRTVASAMSGTGHAMGIIPIGTGNLFARNMGIPIDDIDAALTVATSHGSRHVDVGRLSLLDDPKADHGHAFLIIAGVGFDAAMIDDTDPQLKKNISWLAYFVGGVKNLFTPKYRGDVTITSTDGSMHTRHGVRHQSNDLRRYLGQQFRDMVRVSAVGRNEHAHDFRVVDALAGFGLESQAAPGDDDLAGTVLGEYDVVVEHAKNFHGIPSGRSAVAPIGS